MAFRPRFRQSNVLNNYRRVREKAKCGTAGTDGLMEWLRISFALEDHLGYEQLFKDYPEKLAIKQSVNSYTYEVSQDGQVLFPIQEDNTQSISVSDIYKALEKFDNTVISDITDCKDKSKDILMQEISRENLNQDLPDSLSHSSNVQESSSKKFEGESRSEGEIMKKCEEVDSSDVNPYREYKNQCIRQYNEHHDFLRKNYEEINSEYKKITEQPDCILTYRKTGEDEIKYRFFPNKQAALEWAYKEIGSIEKHFVCIETSDKTDSPVLTLKQFTVIPTKITKPKSRKAVVKESSEVVVQERSFFDSGAEVASTQYDSEKLEQMIHSATKINDEMEPIVYGGLTIRSEQLQRMYETHVQDGGLSAIGLPQMADTSDFETNQIIDQMRDIINRK